MAFHVYLNRDDLQAMQTQVMRADMPAGEAQTVTRVWNGGLLNWDVATRATTDKNLGDMETRDLVMSPQGMGVAEFAAFLRRIAGYFPGDEGAQYMDALADHISNTGTES
jgi:hypothetical protein